MLMLAPARGFALFCAVSIFFSFALVPVALTRAGNPGVVRANRSGLRRVAEVSPVAVFGTFALGLAMGAFWGMAPSYGERIGLDKTTVSVFLTSTLIGALILQWPMGWLSDLVDRRIVIAAAAAIATIAALALASESDDRFRLIAIGLAFGGFSMPLYSVCVAHANDQVGREEVVAVASALILVYGIGSAAGPFSASLLMNWLGQAWLFVFLAAILAGLSATAMARMLARSEDRDREKPVYVSVPQTSHAALTMHRGRPGHQLTSRRPGDLDKRASASFLLVVLSRARANREGGEWRGKPN